MRKVALGIDKDLKSHTMMLKSRYKCIPMRNPKKGYIKSQHVLGAEASPPLSGFDAYEDLIIVKDSLIKKTFILAGCSSAASWINHV